MSAKTILMQMRHKSESFEMIGRKLVLVVQAEFFDYLSREFTTTHIRLASPNDSVQFHIYNVVADGDHVQISLKEQRSTTSAGIEKMLALGRDAEISDETVRSHITAKWSTGRFLDTAIPLEVRAIDEDGVSVADDEGGTDE